MEQQGDGTGTRTAASRSATGLLVGATVVLIAVVFAAVASATAPSNDDFAAAQTVPAEGGTLDGSNMDSSAQTGEPAHGGSPYGALHSIWYRWTPPADGEKAKAKLKITFTDEAGNSDNQKLTLKLR